MPLCKTMLMTYHSCPRQVFDAGRLLACASRKTQRLEQDSARPGVERLPEGAVRRLAGFATEQREHGEVLVDHGLLTPGA